MLSDSEIIELENLLRLREIEKSQSDLFPFTRFTFPKFESTPFHIAYYTFLNLFASGVIKKVMISVPPQHGKSQGSSIQLPAYMAGKNPDLNIATVCYSATKARKFGRKVKQLMYSKEYKELFPAVELASKKSKDRINTAEEFEIEGHSGSLKMIGYKGGLTGDPVDILLLDDLYKGWKEANSPVIRNEVQEFYDSVADTRLHNDSQQLIVFTRWHPDDLIGYLQETQKVIEVKDWSDFDNVDPEAWYKINFEAIKTGEPTGIDEREAGAALWPQRHSLKRLEEKRLRNSVFFDCLYQGNPSSKEGLLYGYKWHTYKEYPEDIIIYTKNYTDTADRGDDYLCSIDYGVGNDGKIYILDVRYTPAPMEITEPLVAGGLLKNKVKFSDIESNNGGRGFARKVNELCNPNQNAGITLCYISWFTQSENKESRIVTNSATVLQTVVFPENWAVRWPDFCEHICSFKRTFKANEHDDAEDCLTGCVERKDIIPAALEETTINVWDL